ncbi:MAG TPA: glycoside hydrolase family 15 protein [Actinomycetota bacterium]|nr:glycoside hydrolase family 15 protein [Actinomycetota bacterium]
MSVANERPPSEPLAYHDGYPPLEHLGLIGDGTTAALVARDGAVVWLCAPRFDSDALFCSLLDHRHGGFFKVSPAGARASSQWYETDTGVLHTEIEGPTGTVRITDCLTLRAGADLAEDAPAGRSELLRHITVVEGTVDMLVEVEPRGGATCERRGGGLWIVAERRPELDLQLASTMTLEGLRSSVRMEEGEEAELLLRWTGASHRHLMPGSKDLLAATVDCWKRWIRCLEYDGPQEQMVRRSIITLKMLDYNETGAMVAAPTSSLPEEIGGVRNWDYRYAWVRDAAFSVYALRRAGLVPEAWGFLGWVLDAMARDGQAMVLYDLDGKQPEEEWEDPELEGYRQSAPVRWGNKAASQRQHDAYGEIMDCAYQWGVEGGPMDPALWDQLRDLAEKARRDWNEPDHGIWEIRSPGRVFTYSAAMCQVALDRAARLAERLDLPGDIEGWKAEAEKVRKAILERSWDPEQNSLTEHLGEGGLDASLLALPLRGVISARDPKMVATVEAIQKTLGVGEGLLHRYLPSKSDDGLPGEEGAFLLCSFWLVDNLAYQGRLDEARELYDSLCARAGPTGLLPEEIDPETGAFLGNFPQAFSHVGVISSGLNLAKLTE